MVISRARNTREIPLIPFFILSVHPRMSFCYDRLRTVPMYTLRARGRVKTAKKTKCYLPIFSNLISTSLGDAPVPSMTVPPLTIFPIRIR